MKDNEFREIPNTDDELSDIVELVDEDDVVRKFYHVNTVEYKGEWYAGFLPAEEMEGADEDELVIFKIVGDEDDEKLETIDDELLLDDVYQEFLRIQEEDELAEEAMALECDEDCDNCSNQCPQRKDN